MSTSGTLDALKPYTAYKDSGVPWLGQVPEHWDVRRLRHIFAVFNGATPASGDPSNWNGDITWITPADLGRLRSRYIKASERRISASGYQNCGTTLAPAGSIALSTRAPIGHLAITQVASCVNQGCRLLVPRDAKSTVYWYYVLSAARPALESLGQGATFVELSRGDLLSVRVLCPSRSEQAAIVRFLDHADRRIRRYIRTKRKLIKLLEEQTRILISEAVTYGLSPSRECKPCEIESLTKIPASWQIRPLIRCCSERSDYRGATPTKTETGTVLVTAKNIRPGWIDYETSKEYVNPDDYDRIMRRGRPQIGDLLFTTEAPLGNFALVDREGVALAQRVIRFRLDGRRVLPHFGLHAVLSPYFQDQLLRRATGSTALGIKASKLPQLQLVVPPIAEQQQIIDWIALETSVLRASIDRARAEIGLLLEYRTGLIADVVTGKLDVREAAASLPDEAEELEELPLADEAMEDGDAADDLAESDELAEEAVA